MLISTKLLWSKNIFSAEGGFAKRYSLLKVFQDHNLLLG